MYVFKGKRVPIILLILGFWLLSLNTARAAEPVVNINSSTKKVTVETVPSFTGINAQGTASLEVQGPGDFFTIKGYAEANLKEILSHTDQQQIQEYEDRAGRLVATGFGSYVSYKIPFTTNNINVTAVSKGEITSDSTGRTSVATVSGDQLPVGTTDNCLTPSAYYSIRSSGISSGGTYCIHFRDASGNDVTAIYDKGTAGTSGTITKPNFLRALIVGGTNGRSYIDTGSARIFKDAINDRAFINQALKQNHNIDNGYTQLMLADRMGFGSIEGPNGSSIGVGANKVNLIKNYTNLTDAQKENFINKVLNDEPLTEAEQTILNNANKERDIQAINNFSGFPQSLKDLYISHLTNGTPLSPQQRLDFDFNMKRVRSQNVIVESVGSRIGTEETNVVRTNDNNAALVKRLQEATDGTKPTGACIIWDWQYSSFLGLPKSQPGASLPACFAQVFYIILWLASFIVGFVGNVFNAVFVFTVVNIASFVGNDKEGLSIIRVGWTVVRDIANICFIFVLLYLAIATILQIDEHGVKHSLSRLIIAAVLINFSLFFTKIIIDVPNIMSIEIYDKITTDEGGRKVDLGDAFMTLFQPQLILKDPSQSASSILNNSAVKNAGDLTAADAKQFASGTSPFTTFAMGIILDAFIILVFAAVCVIFIKRFVVLLFLMIFSPLAFVGMAIPISSLQGMAKEKFWNTLIKESFYAPIFMLCVYITLQAGRGIMQADFLSGRTFSALIDVQQIFSFAVLIVMLVASLIIAEMMGVRGAAGAMAVYNKGKSMATGALVGGAMGATGFGLGWATRNTVGRFAQTLVNKQEGWLGHSDTIAGWATGRDRHGNPLKGGWLVSQAKQRLARGLIRTARAAGKGFTEKEIGAEVAYYEARIEEAHGDQKEIGKILREAGGKGISSAKLQAADDIFKKLNSDGKAGVRLEMEKDIRNEHIRRVDSHGNAVETDQQWSKRVDLTKGVGESDEAFQHRVMEAHGSRLRITRNAGEDDETYEKRIGDQLIKNDKGYSRYYLDHGGGRMEQPEISEVERKMRSNLPFWDREFQNVIGKPIERIEGESDAEYGARRTRAHAVRVEGMKKMIKNAQSNEQGLSMLKSLPKEARAMFEGDDPESVNLRNELTSSLRNRFTDEIFFSSAVKDSLFGAKMKEAISAPVWKMAETVAVYGEMTKAGEIGRAIAKYEAGGPDADNQIMTEFERQTVDLDVLAPDRATYNLVADRTKRVLRDATATVVQKQQARIDLELAVRTFSKAFEDKRFGLESPAASYSTQTNGERTMIKSKDVVESRTRVYGIIGDIKTAIDNVKTGKASISLTIP
ncbi:MAG TPA: GA module-containing protein, partial [Candidatus Paceibacterota bacterium]